MYVASNELYDIFSPCSDFGPIKFEDKPNIPFQVHQAAVSSNSEDCSDYLMSFT
jgi:hypothetical protein